MECALQFGSRSEAKEGKVDYERNGLLRGSQAPSWAFYEGCSDGFVVVSEHPFTRRMVSPETSP